MGETETEPWRARDRCKAMSTSRVRWRSRASGSMGLKERESVGDLRAMASGSLSRDELRYRRVGEPSQSLWMDLGEEEMGSLVEVIEKAESETFST